MKSHWLQLTVPLFFAVFAVAGAPSVCRAQLPPHLDWSPEGILVNDTPGFSTQKNPKIVAGEKDTFIIVWTDERAGYDDLYVQKIDSDGNLKWSPDGIPLCSESKNQSSPQIISGEKGGAIVVWEDYRNGSADIYIQKINSDGRLSWGKSGVPVCKAPAAQLAPQVAYDGAGGAIVTWYDYRSGKGEDIYAQRIDSTGKVQWQEDGIPVSASTGTQWYPEITADGSGGAIIAWTDFRSAKGSDIYSQRIDSNGVALWQKNGMPVCSAKENQAYPKVTSDGSGGTIIAWDDFRSGNFNIYAQRISSVGKPIWQLNGVAITEGKRSEERPAIAGAPGGGAFLCWASRHGGASEIFAQKIDGSGKIGWKKGGIRISETPGKQEQYKIQTSHDGGAVIVWEETYEGQKDILSQKITESGLFMWGLNGVVACNTPDDSEFPEVAENGNGNVIIVWQDRKDGNLDIYAQSLASDGSIRWNDGGRPVNSSVGSVPQQNPKIALNENGSHVIIWEDGRAGYADIYAQKIDTFGSLMWGLNGLPVVGARMTQKNPRIISAGEGSVVVAWEDFRNGKNWDIYVQKISTHGEVLWDRLGIIVSTSKFNKSEVSLISDGAGGAILAWEEKRGESLSDIYAQKINASGMPMWGERGMALCTSQNDQIDPVICGDGNGGVVAAWVDYRNGLFNSDIFAQKLDKNGISKWKNRGIEVCTAPDTQRSPAIVEAGSGSVIISWTDKGGGSYDIYAQVLDASGVPKLTSDGIPVCQAPGTQRNPKMTRGADNRTIIVWNDFRNANWDIYAQSMSLSGELQWDESGLPVCTAPLTQYSPQLVGSDSATIFAWEDYRNAESYNIYAQKVDAAGNMMWEPNGSLVSAGGDGKRNPCIAKSGTGGAVIAWEDYRSGGPGIYAQKIKVIKLE